MQVAARIMSHLQSGWSPRHDQRIDLRRIRVGSKTQFVRNRKFVLERRPENNLLGKFGYVHGLAWSVLRSAFCERLGQSHL